MANPSVKLTTNYGEITLSLHEDKAPNTVENFLNYVKEDFYSNTIFHRVIDGFMIQGGGFEPGMDQKTPSTAIANEANNGLSNNIGTVAMARTNDPHSATCQFFINIKDNSFLNFRSETPDGWGYCVFAEVSDGMDVVNKIKNVKTSNASMHQDVPVEDVVIQKAEIS